LHDYAVAASSPRYLAGANRDTKGRIIRPDSMATVRTGK
jgi:hypothetical protein